jgi:hypothetical protein
MIQFLYLVIDAADQTVLRKQTLHVDDHNIKEVLVQYEFDLMGELDKEALGTDWLNEVLVQEGDDFIIKNDDDIITTFIRL